jgi:hypothetical protein
MTQTERILADLERGRVVDSLTALRRFGCMRLAARVGELRAAGHKIVTERRRVRTRDGHASVALYRMV